MGVPVSPDARLWTPAIRFWAPLRALTTPYPVVPRGPTSVVRTAPPRPFIECGRVRRSDVASDLRVLVARHAPFGVAPRDLTTGAKGRAATTLHRVCSGKTTQHDTRLHPLPVSQVEGGFLDARMPSIGASVTTRAADPTAPRPTRRATLFELYLTSCTAIVARRRDHPTSS